MTVLPPLTSSSRWKSGTHSPAPPAASRAFSAASRAFSARSSRISRPGLGVVRMAITAPAAAPFRRVRKRRKSAEIYHGCGTSGPPRRLSPAHHRDGGRIVTPFTTDQWLIVILLFLLGLVGRHGLDGGRQMETPLPRGAERRADALEAQDGQLLAEAKEIRFAAPRRRQDGPGRDRPARGRAPRGRAPRRRKTRGRPQARRPAGSGLRA